MGNEGNGLFQEILDILDQMSENYKEYKEKLKEQYKALETIYLRCYNKYLEEQQAKQSVKIEPETTHDVNEQNEITQEVSEPKSSYCGDIWESPHNRMMQEQKMPKFQIQDHRTIVASDIHGDIEDFLKILLENDLIILENSYQLVDLKTLESYDTFASFEEKVQNEDDKIFLDARCVILPKFELNKDINVTFNYLGDLIDEGRFSIECFYIMMLLMEKAKSCDNFEINYIAGNHEIANIILESKDTKDQRLRQCTKYYCYKYDDEKYLARSGDSDQTILKKLHNFQMGCVAEHSKKLIENGQMKLAHVDGNKVFIHANPSLDSVISFLNIGKTKDEINEIIENTIYSEQSEFLGKSEEDKRQYYLERLNELNTFFAEEVKENNLCDFNFDTEFLTYISACGDGSVYGIDCYCPTFLPNFLYFVGHDSGANWEYTFDGNKLYCLDGHNISNHRFANIVNDKVYCCSVKLDEFYGERNELRELNRCLENEIAKKCEQNSLNEGTVKQDATTLSSLENANAETDYRCMPKKRSGCSAI